MSAPSSITSSGRPARHARALNGEMSVARTPSRHSRIEALMSRAYRTPTPATSRSWWACRTMNETTEQSHAAPVASPTGGCECSSPSPVPEERGLGVRSVTIFEHAHINRCASERRWGHAPSPPASRDRGARCKPRSGAMAAPPRSPRLSRAQPEEQVAAASHRYGAQRASMPSAALRESGWNHVRHVSRP